MDLYEQYSISPENHTVSHPERAEQSYGKQGIREALSYIILGSTISAFLLGIHVWLDEGVTEDRYDGVMEWITLMVWGTAGLVGLVMFPYMLYCGVRSLLVSLVRPNLSSPESTLKAFLNSVRSSLHIRADNLLTDQARCPGKITLTGGVEAITGKMPDIEINDMQSFKDFWVGIDRLSWKVQTRRIEYRQLDNDAAVLLRVPVKAEVGGAYDKNVRFNVEFVAVRRNSRWFLANGFVWPV